MTPGQLHQAIVEEHHHTICDMALHFAAEHRYPAEVVPMIERELLQRSLECNPEILRLYAGDFSLITVYVN